MHHHVSLGFWTGIRLTTRLQRSPALGRWSGCTGGNGATQLQSCSAAWSHVEKAGQPYCFAVCWDVELGSPSKI